MNKILNAPVLSLVALLALTPVVNAQPLPDEDFSPQPKETARTRLATSQKTFYVNPATGLDTAGKVLRPFLRPAHNWEAGHRGVDLELPVGGWVKASGSGTVAFAGVVAGRPSVSIEHADGMRSTYTPVFALVDQGQSVNVGDVVGTLAPAPDSHPGLHWGMLQGKDDYVNPLLFLEQPVIRLKSLTGALPPD